MLDQHMGECMLSIINIDNIGIKEHICRYQNCNTNQLLIFRRYVKVKKIFGYPSYYLDQYPSKHDWKVILLKEGGSTYWYQTKNKLKIWKPCDRIPNGIKSRRYQSNASLNSPVVLESKETPHSHHYSVLSGKQNISTEACKV